MKIAKIKLLSSMFIFGTIGLFVKFIPIDSALLACLRGFIGGLFLIAFMAIGRKPVTKSEIKNNLLLLILSGAAIGVNWVLLFESYRYTTVATATLCYYMEPVIVVLVSPLLFKEKIGLKKGICVLIAFAGMVLVSGITNNSGSGAKDFKGILFGLGAAVLYATAVCMNKFIRDISTYTKTSVQLLAAAIVLVPYLIAKNVGFDVTTTDNIMLVIILVAFVGIVHTGVAYALFFGSADKLPAQTIALMGYIDPVVAILLSVFVLKENIEIPAVVGAVLVLMATAASEIDFTHKEGEKA